MSILAAFMVPHPPLIVPAVGKGGEKEIIETTRAYERVADEIAALAPDTIIITSPHSVMYADYFHISPGSNAKGSFARFGAPEVSFKEEYDKNLTDMISDLAEKEGFPAGTLGEKDPALDHGTMVPLYFIRQKYRGGKIVRIGLSGLTLAEHYHFGQMIATAVNAIDVNAVIIASGDLSHKLQEYGPYGFAKEGPEYDKRIMEVCERADFGRLFDFDETFCEKAAECGHRSFVIMAGAFDGMAVKATKLSHQDVTGVGYGICTFYPQGADESRHFLKEYVENLEKELKEKAEKSDAYVKLAR
ncbi:MAG: AmmeMemoRadiSam system protein A, partial [Lachnospiraceae bacterium]|nr:AmmeMemoRadiSam system protein A [Lachnospiraceae bacterium]